MAVYTRRLVAELVGTFVLVTFGGFSIFAANFGNAAADGAPLPQGTPVLIIAFGFVLGSMVALYVFGEVSGGRFNPAVSIAMLTDRRLDASSFIMYVIAQVAGAVLAPSYRRMPSPRRSSRRLPPSVTCSSVSRTWMRCFSP